MTDPEISGSVMTSYRLPNLYGRCVCVCTYLFYGCNQRSCSVQTSLITYNNAVHLARPTGAWQYNWPCAQQYVGMHGYKWPINSPRTRSFQHAAQDRDFVDTQTHIQTIVSLPVAEPPTPALFNTTVRVRVQLIRHFKTCTTD
eukprot:COSAG05_NODE_7932_length_754_cov_1.354198_1_plen_142_part_10